MKSVCRIFKGISFFGVGLVCSDFFTEKKKRKWSQNLRRRKRKEKIGRELSFSPIGKGRTQTVFLVTKCSFARIEIGFPKNYLRFFFSPKKNLSTILLFPFFLVTANFETRMRQRHKTLLQFLLLLSLRFLVSH